MHLHDEEAPVQTDKLKPGPEEFGPCQAHNLPGSKKGCSPRIVELKTRESGECKDLILRIPHFTPHSCPLHERGALGMTLLVLDEPAFVRLQHLQDHQSYVIVPFERTGIRSGKLLSSQQGLRVFSGFLWTTVRSASPLPLAIGNLGCSSVYIPQCICLFARDSIFERAMCIIPKLSMCLVDEDEPL